MKLREQAVLLGERKSLVGIVTQAVGGAAPVHEVALVFLNTGIIHRVGHHRMYVTFSRVLAAEGYTVLRFDLSGIGDSDYRIDGLSPLESNLSDIKEVLDWLETTKQAKRVILVGLCWGADSAVHYAAGDTQGGGARANGSADPANAAVFPTLYPPPDIEPPELVQRRIRVEQRPSNVDRVACWIPGPQLGTEVSNVRPPQNALEAGGDLPDISQSRRPIPNRIYRRRSPGLCRANP
jgi:alpha/beta superfamily hydrolase